MDLYAVLDQVVDLVRQRKRITYRLLQRQFALDEVTLEDLKAELFFAHPQIADADRHGLIWTGDADVTPAPAPTPAPAAPPVPPRSQQANACEAGVIEALVQAACTHLRLDATTGLGIVVPHRAQKALLQARLPHLAGAVDTVERFQGGERDLILVSATVSDLAYAQSESDFLLEPRRLTVAVSRPKRKLIVLASQALFTLMPADLDAYERGALWKQLRHACASPPLWTGEYGSYWLRVLTIQAP